MRRVGLGLLLLGLGATGCGYITEADREKRWDVDGDGVERPDDCDDDDPDIGRARVFFPDADGDQFGDGDAGVEACTPPDEHVTVGGDCDDDRASANPAASELCNDADDDCDGQIDEELDKTVWYRDADGDRFGDDTDTTTACEQPDGYAAIGGDCDDGDPAIHPDAVEVCDPDDVDENCDDIADDPSVEPFDHTSSDFAPDLDGDGFGDATAAPLEPETCDPPAGWLLDRSDCDDTDPAVPAVDELCDGIDNDCDGITDEDAAIDAVAWYADFDGDGYGDPMDVVFSCTDFVADRVRNSVDCEDGDADIYPLADEICDGIDNNCNLEVDTADPFLVGAPRYYDDGDVDGFGDPATGVVDCAQPAGTVALGLDCDDGDGGRNPDAPEVCDGIDNDCDGFVDDADSDVDSVSAPTWYIDADGDGYGSTTVGVVSCSRPPGHADNPDDCDDSDRFTFPGATELCDGVDNDCDIDVDETLPEWAPDVDGDGFGDLSAPTQVLCNPGPGFSPLITDCDDSRDDVYPGAFEACDGADNDCSGTPDDGVDAQSWYLDDDGDGFGDPAEEVTSCLQPPNYVLLGTDCNDADPDIAPDAPEICNGDIDDDCDGQADDGELDEDVDVVWYIDTDADGAGDPAVSLAACTQPPGYVATPDDCDDDAFEISPTAPEVCDGIDNDCDGLVDDEDSDLDVNEGSTWYRDQDGDGYGDLAQPSGPSCAPPPGHVAEAGDCDDADPQQNPGWVELCNSEDDDCDGIVDEDTPPTWYEDLDGDGWGTAANTVVGCADPGPGFSLFDGDCDDGDPNRNPDAPEICNGGIDDDCDSQTEDVDPDLAEPVWHTDADGDGYGDPDTRIVACTQPVDAVADATDCDDDAYGVNPGATEVCDDIDNDCDGLIDDADTDSGTDLLDWYFDGDGDEVGDPAVSQSACDPDFGFVAACCDCDDSDFKIKPGADEECDGRDNDCDTLVDDDDGDLVDGPCIGDAGEFPGAACAVSPTVGDPTTLFTVDALGSSDPEGEGLEARFELGDGTPVTAFSAALTTTHTYAGPGVYEVTCEVRDPGDQVARATATAVVVDPARWLVVDTAADDNDAEVYGGPYTNGLSLREAITLANGNVGPDAISFDPAVATIFATSGLPTVTDDDLVIAGHGSVVVDGSATLGAVGLTVDASGVTVTGVELADWDTGLHVLGGATGFDLRDASLTANGLGARLDDGGSRLGPGVVVAESTGAHQLDVFAPVRITGVVVRDGLGNGISIRAAGAGAVVELSTSVGNAGHGVLLFNSGGGADGSRIVDSTIVLNGMSGIDLGAQVSDIEVRNDVIAFNGDWGIDATAGNFVAGSPDYNLYFSNGSGACSGCVPGASAIVGDDPLLSDLFGVPVDVCPLVGSPVIDAGTELTLTDRNGWALGAFDGTAPEIGACERP